ncbi:hypothetical protein CLU87_0601 [Acidovorax sp. 59]|nr:hypothetical protein CLU87_0601 [Acidovorax sp. 59]
MARSAVRLFGCSAAWLLGCLAAWLLGCLAAWLLGCLDVRLSNPLLAATAAGRLRGEHGRRSAHASSTDSPWMSERRAQRKASSTAHPATAPPQVCPFAQRRGRRLGVAFSLVTFFWRSKRKLLARRATPGSRPQARHAAQSATTRKRYKINSHHRISHWRIQPKSPQTGPKAIRPEEVTDASLACRVSTRLRPARFAS